MAVCPVFAVENALNVSPAEKVRYSFPAKKKKKKEVARVGNETASDGKTIVQKICEV